jgi:hypothetical protein
MELSVHGVLSFLIFEVSVPALSLAFSMASSLLSRTPSILFVSSGVWAFGLFSRHEKQVSKLVIRESIRNIFFVRYDFWQNYRRGYRKIDPIPPNNDFKNVKITDTCIIESGLIPQGSTLGFNTIYLFNKEKF